MSKACRDCCDTPKTVGPPNPDHPSYDRIQCSAVAEDTSRMCKPGGCCDGSDGGWCNELKMMYSLDEMRSICWYCCSIPRDIGRQRELVSGGEMSDKGEERDEALRDNKLHNSDETGRRTLPLMNYNDVPYDAYEWLRKVKTEVSTQSRGLS